MKYTTTQTFQFNTLEMEKLENDMKVFAEKNAELHLDIPHSEKLPQGIISIIQKYAPDNFNIPLNINHSSDELMNERHTDIYALFHPNYFPAVIHDHTHFEIIYLLEGTCNNYSGNQTICLNKGDLLILAPNTKHAISSFSAGCRIMNILIRSSIFEDTFFGGFSEQDILYRFFSSVLYEYKINNLLLYHTKDDPLIRQICLTLFDEQQYFHYFQNSMQTACVSLLFARLLNRHEGNAVIYNDTLSKGNQEITIILRYMQQHFSTISLKKLAIFFGYSERHISRLLTEYTGEGFQKNLQYIRMQHALKLMKNKDYSLENIASILGYSSARNFREIFRHCFGVSPSEYRRNH